MKKFNQWTFLMLGMISLAVVAQDTTQDEQIIIAQAPEQEVQEIKYVTDKLRLSLYKAPNENSGTVKLLTSGDKLKILEQTGNYARVKTDDDQVGWVKRGFLVSEPTASFLLIEETKKNEILVNQLEQYADTQQLVADYENTISLMKADEENISSQLESLQQQLKQLEQANTELQQNVEDAKQGKIGIPEILELAREYWYVIVALIVISILIGFIAGKQMVEAQVKRRFQGVKVW